MTTCLITHKVDDVGHRLDEFQSGSRR